MGRSSDAGSGGEGGGGAIECVQRYALTEPEETSIVRDRDDEFQMMRHVVLLLFLCGSMIVVSALECVVVGCVGVRLECVGCILVCWSVFGMC